MNKERLAEIRDAYAMWEYSDDDGSYVADTVPELLAYVDELTRQRDSARALAVKSGIFQDHFAEVYPQAHEEQPDVGPVAWDRQEQQR